MSQQMVNANDYPKAVKSQKRVGANAACMRTPQDKRPANATPCTVDMDVDAAEERSVTKQTRKLRLTSKRIRTKGKRLKSSLRKLQKPYDKVKRMKAYGFTGGLPREVTPNSKFCRQSRRHHTNAS